MELLVLRVLLIHQQADQEIVKQVLAKVANKQALFLLTQLTNNIEISPSIYFQPISCGHVRRGYLDCHSWLFLVAVRWIQLICPA